MDCFYPHFTDEKVQAPKGSCMSRLHHLYTGKLRFESRSEKSTLLSTSQHHFIYPDFISQSQFIVVTEGHLGTLQNIDDNIIFLNGKKAARDAAYCHHKAQALAGGVLVSCPVYLAEPAVCCP